MTGQERLRLNFGYVRSHSRSAVRGNFSHELLKIRPQQYQIHISSALAERGTFFLRIRRKGYLNCFIWNSCEVYTFQWEYLFSGKSVSSMRTALGDLLIAAFKSIQSVLSAIKKPERRTKKKNTIEC